MPSRRGSREARRRSDDHDDGVAAAWLHENAIDANLTFGKVQKQTLSHGPLRPRRVGVGPHGPDHVVPDGRAHGQVELDHPDLDVLACAGHRGLDAVRNGLKFDKETTPDLV